MSSLPVFTGVTKDFKMGDAKTRLRIGFKFNSAYTSNQNAKFFLGQKSLEIFFGFFLEIKLRLYLFIYKEDMKLKMTISQLREILKTEVPKFPIEIMMSKVDQSELMKIGNLLKKSKRG